MRRKNILLIISHDLGQHIGPYGVETVHTPALDRMAAEGVLFEKNFCTSPSCSPSRASIFSGRFPHSNGVMGLTHGNFMWQMKDVHLAQRLADQGYDTCVVGNWHENDRIDNVGYQTTVVDQVGALSLSDDVQQNEAQPTAQQVAERVGFYLEQQKDSEHPFFLYAGFFEPHRPYDFKGCTPDAEKGVWIPPYIPQDTPEQRAAAEEEFAAMQGCIRRMDDAVGQILQSLEKAGLKEDTLVLFTADHGIAMPRAKCTLYDPGLETPLILWGAGLPKGKRHDCMISNVDYLSTLMEWVGFPIPGNVQGRSFLSLLNCRAGMAESLPAAAGRSATIPALQTDYEPRTEIFGEKNYHREYDPIRCVRTERYKFIINFEVNIAYNVPSDIQKGAIYRTAMERYTPMRPVFELYDLENDPWEQNNLADDAELATVRADLQMRLLQWMKETDDPLLKGPIPSRFTTELLKTLAGGCNE